MAKHGLQPKGVARRNKIILSAVKLFLENGYERTTTSQIMAASGMAQSSFFAAFENKEALLLVLTACGAAPLVRERQAKQQILNAISQYRTSNGAKAVDEIPELSKAEQFWVDAFRKEGDYKVPLSKTDLVYEDYDKMIPAEWDDGPCFGWENILQDGKEYNLLETTDPSDTAALMQLFAEKSDFNDDSYTAVGIGVATINGKIYWACTLYEQRT